MVHLHLLVLGCLSLAAYAHADEDGVFLVDKTGRREKVAPDVGTSTLVSQDNLNTRYYLSLRLPRIPEEASLDLTVGGSTQRCTSWGSDPTGASYGFAIDGDRVKAVGALLGIEPVARAHPGHRIATRFWTGKPVHQLGEPIDLRMAIHNVGTEPFSFMKGGRNRGARDNQFAFAGFRNGKALLDQGDPVHFGGLATVVTVQPGQAHEMEVAILKWFPLDQPGAYEILGTYFFEIVEVRTPGTPIGRPIWEDYAAGSCFFTLEVK